MEDNVALAIRISVTVVLVASVVATVLTLMVIGQSILGGGQNKLQTGLSQIQEQDLQQYSNTTKKGSVVKSVIQLYQGEPVAILVKTTALYTAATSDNGDGKPVNTQPVSGDGWYFNYGCLILDASLKPASAIDQQQHMLVNGGSSGTSSDKLYAATGSAFLEAGLNIQNGVKQTYYDTKGISTIGNIELILDNGIFYGQLIKDVTGQTIGVCFTQHK